MNLHQVISDLREKREHIEQAILVLERLEAGRGKQTGRPSSLDRANKRIAS
jgi:hypothetical protein